MVRLKSRTKACPNGFRYEQKETGWKSWEACPESQWDFMLLCRKLGEHRKANARFNLCTVMGVIENEVDMANAQRMLTIREADSYVEEDFDPPKPSALHGLSEKLAAAVEGIKRTAQGTPLILEWLKHGVPVDKSIAIRRALVCIACPMNNLSHGVWDRFTEAASARIREQVASRSDLKLETLMDDRLGICDACLCPLKTKIWVPIEDIKAHLHPDVAAELWSQCWITKEIHGAAKGP
jgi:hypothetical protein